jgi:hypothetical protein
MPNGDARKVVGGKVEAKACKVTHISEAARRYCRAQPKAVDVYYSICGLIDQHNPSRQDTLMLERNLSHMTG